MRAILASSVRPRIGQTQPMLVTGANASIRRTAIPSLRPKLKLCDAFTILLAPVLTAAFVADVVQKDTRRRSWDEKIATIQQELESYRKKEAQTWQTLQIRSVQAGLAHQRRPYSTGTAASRDRGNYDTVKGDSPGPSSTDQRPPPLLQRYEHLVARKVGLQLLLYITTGQEATGQFVLQTEGLDDNTLDLNDMEMLLKHHRAVTRELHELRRDVVKLLPITYQSSYEQMNLDSTITQLTWQCRTGAMTITEFVYTYTQAVINAGLGLKLKTYKYLVEALSTLDADPLAFIAMSPYLLTRQVLNDEHVANIIRQYGKTKDHRRLTQFLNRLPLPNESRGFATSTNWEFVVVRGVRVSVPYNKRSEILDELIRAGLQCDQPHNARAWTTLLFQKEISPARLANVYNNFLTYCARHLDWKHGQIWLQRTIAWAALFAESSPLLLPKLIFRLLDLCVACQQDEMYNTVLNGAVIAGIEAPPLDDTRPEALASIARRIRKDWITRMEQSREQHRDFSAEGVEAVKIFQAEVAKADTFILDFIGVTKISKLRRILQTWSTDIERDPSATTSPSNSLLQFRDDHLNITNNLVAPIPSDQDSPIYESTRGEDNSDSVSATWLPFSQEDKKAIVQQSEPNTQSMELRQATSRLEALRSRNLDLMRQLESSNTKEQELQNRLDQLEKQNSGLAVTLETSNAREQQLVALADQLTAQLNTPKPKSLEAVFVEKENYKLRTQFDDLSSRYLNVLKKSSSLDKELTVTKAQLENLVDQRTTETSQLRQEKEDLEDQLRIMTTKHQKLLQSSKAREANLQKIHLVNEERVRKLRAEISQMTSSSQGAFET